MNALYHFTESQEVIQTMLNHMNDGLMLTNAKKKIVAVNPAFERMTGYSLNDVEGQDPNILKSGLTPRTTYEDMWKTIRKKGTWTGELCNERKDGTLFWSYITITEVKLDHEDGYYIGMMRDITERKKNEEKMRYNAYHDALTRLPNRLYFKKELERSLQQAAKNKEKIAVLFLDLDRFKKVNDSYGHQAGDELLSELAQRVEEAVGNKGVASRFGGDEFTIYLPNIPNTAYVDQVIEHIFKVLSEPFIIKGQEIYMTMSIGLSYYHEHGDNFDTLLKNADSAMYQTKDERKNNYSIYEKEMNQQVANELSFELELLEGLRQNQLEVYYQLQVELDHRKPFGVEALIRWNHPTRGVLSPAIFLPLAEDMGIIADIDEFVLQEACKQNKKWHLQGHHDLVVSVNISKQFFERPDFVKRVHQVLDSTKLSPQYLCVEITENTPILTVKDIRQKLDKLKEVGVKVSLDDFGTGYSTLSKLESFPIDSLKIDQSFVRGRYSKKNRAIVKLIIEMANSLDMAVICEGVETEEQLQLLKEEGCNRAQGYLFSRPIPADECSSLIHQLKEEMNCENK